MSQVMKVPFISKADIEQLMEDEIKISSLWPRNGTFFKIENFLEKHLNVLLDVDCTLPHDVMGEVVFPRKNQHVRVNINKDLTYAAEGKEFRWTLFRWRMTIAHETAHVILHGPLFRSVGSQEDDQPKTHRCSKENLSVMGSSGENKIGRQPSYESNAIRDLEFQANYAAAVLLMPQSIFVPTARKIFDRFRIEFPNSPISAIQKRVISDLGDLFGASNLATRIRCEQLQKLEVEQMPLLTD